MNAHAGHLSPVLPTCKVEAEGAPGFGPQGRRLGPCRVTWMNTRDGRPATQPPDRLVSF